MVTEVVRCVAKTDVLVVSRVFGAVAWSSPKMNVLNK